MCHVWLKDKLYGIVVVQQWYTAKKKKKKKKTQNFNNTFLQ